MNKIGTLGDLGTGVFEVVLIGVCMGCGMWLEDYQTLWGPFYPQVCWGFL